MRSISDRRATGWAAAGDSVAASVLLWLIAFVGYACFVRPPRLADLPGRVAKFENVTEFRDGAEMRPELAEALHLVRCVFVENGDDRAA